MDNFPPNIDSKLATFSAVVIGFALINDFSAEEQKAIGTWFITIGQVLFTNASWQAMIESRIMGNTININSKKYKHTGNPYMDNPSWAKSPHDEELERLKKIVNIMQEEIDKLQ